MDILALLNNPIIQVLGSGFGVLLAGGIGLWIYKKLKFGSLLKLKGKEFGYAIGKFFWHNAVKNIKEDKLRDQVITDLDIAGDEFDEGFDLGIRGLPLK